MAVVCRVGRDLVHVYTRMILMLDAWQSTTVGER